MNTVAASFVCLFCVFAAAATGGPAPAGRSDSYGGGPELCVVQSPLATPLFKAWRQLDGAVATRGCHSRPSVVGGKTNAYEVHVISVRRRATGAATLEIDARTKQGNTRLVLVLDADAGVKWTIRAIGGGGGGGGATDPNMQHSVVVTGDSTVEQSDLRIGVTQRSRESRHALLRYVERSYRTVHSFSQIDADGSPLRVRLTLTNGTASASSASSGCDYNASQPSPLVTAWKVEPQTIEGCFHAEQAGIYPRDVHVIDLDNGQLAEKADNYSVFIHLAADGVDDESSHGRDLALVLKSARPVQWVLTSAPVLSGSVLVVSEHPVEPAGLSARQPIQVRNGHDVPSAFPVLILSVTAELGPPVSYVRAPSGTRRIELVVSKKMATRFSKVASGGGSGGGGGKQTAPESLSGAASHGPPTMELGVRSLDRTGAQQMANRGGQQRGVTLLQQALKVHCGSNQLTVSLAKAAADAHGVTGLFLNDRTCSGARNATHWTIKKPLTSCGSTSRIDGKLTTYSNTVFVQLASAQQEQSDDEDFEGSGMDEPSPSSYRQVTVPVQCHAQPHSAFVTSGDDDDDDDDVMDTVDLSVGQAELYHMEIHRNKEWTVPVVAAGDPSKAEVVFDETLHVKAWIDGVPYIRIVAEKCWVSNSSSSEDPARLILIRNTCPADLSVQVRESGGRDQSSAGFSFHVSKDYAEMGQLYIHCKLGLCTQQQDKIQGNLRMCVDPAQYCTGRHVLKPFLDESISTAQQILVRGPFRMVAKASPILPRISTPNTIEVPQGPKGSVGDGTPSTQVIVVGVSTEVTVGIALASFLIGVGLTGVLWCIHMRTDPYRRVMNRKSRTGRQSNNRCSGVKCSPMIRARSGADPRPSHQQVSSSLQQQQQQQLVPPLPASQDATSAGQPQFTYDYDVSSSQSHTSGSQCSREDSTPSTHS